MFEGSWRPILQSRRGPGKNQDWNQFQRKVLIGVCTDSGCFVSLQTKVLYPRVVGLCPVLRKESFACWLYRLNSDVGHSFISQIKEFEVWFCQCSPLKSSCGFLGNTNEIQTNANKLRRVEAELQLLGSQVDYLWPSKTQDGESSGGIG